MKVFFFSGSFVNLFNKTQKFRGYFIQREGKEVVGYLREEGSKPRFNAIKGLFDEEEAKLLLVKTTTVEAYVQDIYMFIFQDMLKVGKQSSYNHAYNTFSAYGGITTNTVRLDVLTSVSMSEKNIQYVQDMYASLYEGSTNRSKKLAGDVKKYMWLFNYLKYFEGSAL